MPKKKIHLKYVFIILIVFLFNLSFYRTIYGDINQIDIVKFPILNQENFPSSNRALTEYSVDNSSNNNDFISGLLSNDQPIKITADPNEKIDLFSGNLNLSYKDISIQVVPGLNMEYRRSYSSAIYDKFPFYDKRHWQYNMAQNGWHTHSGYISVLKSCHDNSNLCQPVYIDANGLPQTLLADDNANANINTKFRTIRHYQFIKNAAGYTMIAPDGFKYYFTHYYKLKSSYRFYLTRVETLDAKHYVQYHYSDILLTKITSSDLNKIISVEFETFEIKLEKEKQYITQPVAVYFNNKLMANYGYAFTRFAHHQNYTLVPIAVRLANGMSWQYGYGYIDLRKKHHKHGEFTNRLFLTSITHPDKEVTEYFYNIDYDLNYNNDLHGLRLAYRHHKGDNKIEDGFWAFATMKNSIINNIPTKLVRVKGPYNTIDYIYYDYHHENLWQTGLPAEIKIYADHDLNNLLQHEFYAWASVTHNNYPYKASIIKNGDVFDNNTKRPILINKTIMRGQTIFSELYKEFDKYDNPQLIIQSNGVASRKIKQNILNIEDKNILGLKKDISIDGKLVLSYEYDDYGKITTIEKLGIKTIYKYTDGLLSSSQDILGNSTYYDNYQSGIPGIIKYSDGTIELKEINNDGTLAKYINQNGAKTSFSYDDYGRLISRVSPKGNNIEYSYNMLHQYTKQGTNLKIEQYNTYGLLLESIINNQYKTVIKYDALGRKIFHSDKLGINAAVTGHYYKYDSLNRILSDCFSEEITNHEACTRYNYLDDNTIETIYPNGETKQVTLSGFGAPEQLVPVLINQAGHKTIINRDSLNYVTSIQQGEIIKTYSYDKNYNLIKYIEPETGITEYQYDSLGNLVVRAVNNLVTQYAYDSKNHRLIKVKYSDFSPDEEYRYDKNGNLIFANKGRVTNKYDYDLDNNLIVESTEINNKIFNIKYNYNNLNHLDSVVYPDGSIIDYRPNAFGQPTQLGSYIKNINYHANNHWSDYLYGNGISATAKLDYYNRVNQFNYDVLGLDYIYDNNNNLKRLSLYDQADPKFNGYINFNYDALGRVELANGTLGQISYKYDCNNNLIELNKNGIQKNILEYSGGKLDKTLEIHKNTQAVLNHYSYDKMGNINRDRLNQYVYGLDGNLYNSIRINGTANMTFEYGVNHARAVKKVFDKEIYTIYNHVGLPIYTYDVNTKEYTKYIYLQGKIMAEIAQHKINYYHNDSVGSPVAISDKNGNIVWRTIYLPFGQNVFKLNNLTKYGFVGKEIDQNGLLNFSARYYNPDIARFMSPDPLSVGFNNPFSFNRYIYGNNNPYKYIDADGYSAKKLFFIMTEMSMGFIIGAYSSYEEDHDLKHALLGGIAGSIAAIIASPAASESAAFLAVQGWSVASDLWMNVEKNKLPKIVEPKSVISNINYV